MNMKKFWSLILIVAMVMAVSPVCSQVRLGIKGGLNVSTIHMSDLPANWSNDNVAGYQIGAMIEATMPVTGFGIEADILYSQRGTKANSSESLAKDVNVKSSYIDIPVNLKWKIGTVGTAFYLQGGPYISLRAGGNKNWDAYSSQLKSKSFGAGIDLGAGIQLIKHLQLGITYYISMTDNYSVQKASISNSSSSNAKDRGWSLTAAYLF